MSGETTYWLHRERERVSAVVISNARAVESTGGGPCMLGDVHSLDWHGNPHDMLVETSMELSYDEESLMKDFAKVSEEAYDEAVKAMMRTESALREERAEYEKRRTRLFDKLKTTMKELVSC